MIEWCDYVCGCLKRLHGSVVIMNLRHVSITVGAQHRPDSRILLTLVFDGKSEKENYLSNLIFQNEIHTKIIEQNYGRG